VGLDRFSCGSIDRVKTFLLLVQFFIQARDLPLQCFLRVKMGLVAAIQLQNSLPARKAFLVTR